GRDALERHSVDAHLSGVVNGLEIIFDAPVSPATAATAYVTKGLAVDIQGRQIVVAAALPVLADALSGQSAGAYPVYAWYSESALTPTAGYDPCATVEDRVVEQANVGVFADTTTALTQQPDA